MVGAQWMPAWRVEGWQELVGGSRWPCRGPWGSSGRQGVAGRATLQRQVHPQLGASVQQSLGGGSWLGGSLSTCSKLWQDLGSSVVRR